VPFSTGGADYMLNAWAAGKGLYMSAHSAYSSSGANELTGGSYARVAVAWTSASANSLTLSTSYSINAPSGSTIGWIGFWDASSGGNFQGMFPNAGGGTNYTFSAPSATSILLAPGSGYALSQAVVVLPSGGSVLPAGLTEGTVYYVSAPSSDSFKLSATSGGSAITLTGDGSGYVQLIIVQTYGSPGTFTVTPGTLSLI
jgi:hypothetical protein